MDIMDHTVKYPVCLSVKIVRIKHKNHASLYVIFNVTRMFDYIWLRVI